MDNQTQREINKIGFSVPSHLLRKLIKRNKDDTTQKAVKEYLEHQKTTHRISKKDNPKKVQEIEALQRKGAFAPMASDTIDEKVGQEIRRHIDAKIKQKIQSGELKPPQVDGFMRMVMDNLQRHKK